MINDPLEKFQELYKNEVAQTQAIIPGACCLSTIGSDGYPNARFMALKDFGDEGFILTGSLSGTKGEEIANIPKVALTFWWPTTKVQIRIQGDTSHISRELATKFFHERPREAQLTSLTSKQDQPLDDPLELIEKQKSVSNQFQNKVIPCPDDWGGFLVTPKRIEFLEFSNKRLHTRILYKMEANDWAKEYLQP